MLKTISFNLTFSSLQWFIFIFANTVVVPISIGTAFDLPALEIAGIVRSSLMFTGIACILQGTIGHRLPIMEGHSGVIWGLILSLCLTASSMGMSFTEIGGGVATGMLLAGTLVIILGAINQLRFMHKIFTPMVMNVFLFLLTFQLILIFFKGMLQISEDGTLHVPVSLFSIVLVVFVIFIKIKAGPTIGNYSILIGMITGWILFVLIFPSSQPLNGTPGFFSLPIFPLGPPNLNMGIIIVTFIAGIINISNLIASVQSVSKFREEEIPTNARMNRSYMLTGFFSVMAAFLGLVPYAPYASTIGFLESSRISNRKPFLIGGGIMVIIGLVPVLSGLLATMPITVGNAVLFVAYLQLLGTTLKGLKMYNFNSITIHRVAIPVLVGLSIMNLDTAVFSGLPILLQPLLSNGFIMGVLISIMLENLLKWDS
jgi:xanthine/uracil permease